MEKLIKAEQEVWVLHGRGYISSKKITKTTVSKVGRKYFKISACHGINDEYHLTMNNNGYFHNSMNHNGTYSQVYLSEEAALLSQQGFDLKKRWNNLFNQLGYYEILEILGEGSTNKSNILSEE